MNQSISASALQGKRRLGTAAILGLLSAFGPFSLDMYLPALPMVADDLQSSASLTQLSLTACLVGLALGQLLVGPFSDVRGRRVPLAAGLILYTVVSLLCLLSPSIWSFVGLRFVQGLAGSAGIVLSRAVARDMYSGTELTKFFSLLMLVNGAAPIVAPVAGGQLLHITDWRGVFLVLSLIGAASLVAVLFGLPETLPPAKRTKGGLPETLRTIARITRDREFMGYALAQGLVSAAMFAYISGSPFVLEDLYGVSAQTFSAIFATNGAGIIVASQLAGRLAGRVGERKLLIAGLFIAAAGGISLLAAIASGAGLWAILPLLFVVVSCVGLVGTASFPLAMRNQGQSAGSASALLGVLSYIFGGVVMPLVGLGGSQTAMPMGIIIAAADVLAVAAFFTLVGRRR
ncbi:multidrug effflux MFS transporter [Cohnella thermotolerans]|uniref:multidrug effflux MFS transporter n=1 Tax=Cohnella thermotolerans TaxID=329858 RepID=UPI0004107E46|nr:multidrug effflux MFS transporter [Cohnella thermotolerans]